MCILFHIINEILNLTLYNTVFIWEIFITHVIKSTACNTMLPYWKLHPHYEKTVIEANMIMQLYILYSVYYQMTIGEVEARSGYGPEQCSSLHET
jgi:hypothetical protein